MKLNTAFKELSMIIIALLSILSVIFIGLILIFYLGNVYMGPGVNDFIFPLGNGTYELSRPSIQMACVNKYIENDSVDIISPTVRRINFDDTFIIIEQNPIQNENNIDKFKYWIIDMNKELEYGPFEENEFNLKKLELNINNNLKLKDIDDFRNNKASIILKCTLYNRQFKKSLLYRFFYV
ncbi:DUF3997 domain-containing protein [Clostridium tetani]|nr:DUF3997 domain-containing protein [Clostridium tetani]